MEASAAPPASPFVSGRGLFSRRGAGGAVALGGLLELASSVVSSSAVLHLVFGGVALLAGGYAAATGRAPALVWGAFAVVGAIGLTRLLALSMGLVADSLVESGLIHGAAVCYLVGVLVAIARRGP